MAAALVDVLVTQLGTIIAEPIKRHIQYLFYFKSNVECMTKEAKKLDEEKNGLLMLAADAEYNGRVIIVDVKNWISDVDKIQLKVKEIETENIPKCGFGTIKSRFLASKKAVKMTQEVKELLGRSKFDNISVSQPPAAATGSIPLQSISEFDSRKQTEDDLMTTLKNNGINLVGICGVGGVGKTTMALQIMKRAREENVFEEVLMVVVTQQKDIKEIQLEVAELLGMKLNEETSTGRAHAIRSRLTGNKRNLIVLDDLWDRLRLQDIGIPQESGANGCTTILTSRNMNVFNDMDVQKVFELKLLSESEAEILFKEKVGDCANDVDLLPLAKHIVDECKGLPIALVTVGRALRGKRAKEIWEDALRQLRSSNPTGLWHYLEDVYKPLKMSYDFLANPHAKSIFLLCSMFPEDYDIPIEYLTLCGWGLRMFPGIGNLEEARNNACALTDILRSCFLLLDGKDERHVKMHDVVRDTAIFIASKEGCANLSVRSRDSWIDESYGDSSWISLFVEVGTELATEMSFPNLRLLMIKTPPTLQIQIHDRLFEGASGLYVFYFSSYSLESLPRSIHLLKHIRTLVLDSCTSRTINVLGELSTLEILRCQDCAFEELPMEIGKLSRLRLLELVGCYFFRKLAQGVISQLVELEELKIVGCFSKWDSATLKELELLPNLTWLEIEIDDSSLVAEELSLSRKVVKYSITLGEYFTPVEHDSFYDSLEGSNLTKRLFLQLPEQIPSRNWIDEFVKNTEALFLRNFYLDNWNPPSELGNLKWLCLRECSTLEKLVNTTTSTDLRQGVFPLLETLLLNDDHNLEEICDVPIPEGSNSFKNLNKLVVGNMNRLKHLWKSPNQNVCLSRLGFIRIHGCGNLRNLFSLAIANTFLPQLENLYIEDCKMLEQVFWNEENSKDAERHITFANLKKVRLSELPSLTCFCKEIESVEFPVLTKMKIFNCTKMTRLVSPTRNDLISEGGHCDDGSLHLFCNQEEVSFGNLKFLKLSICEHIVENIWCRQIAVGFFNGLERLVIMECDSVISLFSSSIARNLVNLSTLHVEKCEEMKNVIADEEIVDESPVFINLENLELYTLPNLENFCGWISTIVMPSLKKVDILNCYNIKCFCLGSLTAPALETVSIDCRTEFAGDLNAALHQHYLRRKKYEKRYMARRSQ